MTLQTSLDGFFFKEVDASNSVSIASTPNGTFTLVTTRFNPVPGGQVPRLMFQPRVHYAASANP